MNKKNAVIAGGAAVILLVTAACGSKSTAAPASSTGSSSSAAAASAMSSAPASSGAMSSAAASSGAMTSGAASSGAMTSGAMTSGAASSGAMTSGAMTSGAMTSGAMTSGAMTSGAMTSGATTSGSLDAASTTWFTTLCTGLLPLKADSAKLAAAGSETTDAAKLKAVSEPLLALGKLYSDDAAALTALPVPGIPNGTDYAMKTIAAFGSLADIFTTAGDQAAKGDGTKVKSIQADAAASPDVVAAAKVELSPSLKAEVAKIPVCATSGAMD